MKSSFPLIFSFAIIFLLFDCSMSDNSFIQKSCKEAADNSPNVGYDFCVATLQANPKSQNANLEGLATIIIETSISKATTTGSRILHLFKDTSLDKYTKMALQDCSTLYSDAGSVLHDVLGDLKAKDYSKANTDVSAAMTSSSTCEDGLNEKKGVQSPLTKENNEFFRLNAISLAFINKL